MDQSNRGMQAPSLIRLATTEGVPRRSLMVALVVGSILSAINQGDVILAGEAPNFVKIGLNYVVPFCVATYGAVTAKRAAWRLRSRPAPGGD